jgi:hypothetical protein
MLKFRLFIVGALLTATVATAATAVLVSLASAPSLAKPRPTVDNPNGDDCFNDPDTDKGVGSAIAYCCYDDGCWICGVTPLPGDVCTWDPAYRFVQGQGLLGPLTINPGPSTPIPPRRLPDLPPLVNPPAVAP